MLDGVTNSMKNAHVCIAALLLSVTVCKGLPADDSAVQPRPAYRPLERPAYPLYAIVSGDLPYEQSDIEQLARNFVAAQMTASRETIDRLHTVNPDFKALHYINGTYTRPGDDLRLAESQYRHDFSMYRAGALVSGLDASARLVRVDNEGKPVAIKASTVSGDYSSVDPGKPSTSNYVTWVRVDDELMRLDSQGSSPGTFTVTRGFAGTKPAAHKAGANVFCPAYVGAKGEVGSYPGSPEPGDLRYAFDPGREHGWTWQANLALQHINEGYDGVWLDIVSTVFFNMADMEGEHAQPWNFATGAVYTADEYRLGHERKINFIQEFVKRQTGRYPHLVANNFRGVNYLEGEGGESLLLKSTKAKPRPLDGYCMENTIVGYDGGVKIKDEEDWRQRIAALARSIQDGLAAYPMIGPAGSKSVLLEPDIPERDHFERFGYASYLLAVEKGQRAAFGIPAAYRTANASGERRFIKLNEQYFYPIGDPAESRKWNDLDGYKMPGTHTYARRFSNGIVLVNPSTTVDKALPLGGSFYDPQSRESVSSVDMPAQTGRILLKLSRGATQ